MRIPATHLLVSARTQLYNSHLAPWFQAVIFTFLASALFLAIGYTPAVELAQKTGIELNEDGYIARDAKHRTNIPGIYVAGDVEGGYKQIVTATGMGSEAAMTIFEDLINPYWQA